MLRFRLRRLRYVVLPVLLGSPSNVDAQIQPRDTIGLRAAVPFLTTAFERNVNTFTWEFGGFWSMNRGGWSLQASERFQRTLIKTDRESIKDEQTLSAGAEKAISEQVSLAGSFSSYVFSDNRALALHELTSNKLLGGIVWKPFPEFRLMPMAGFSIDNQQGVLDEGFMYSGSFFLRDVRFADTRISGEGFLTAEHISPRLQREYRVHSDFSSEFSSLARNRGAVSIRRIGRDFYLPIEAGVSTVNRPIESRDEITYALSDRLEYEVTGHVSLLAGLEASQRSIEKRLRHTSSGQGPYSSGTDIDEFRLTGNTAVHYLGRGGTNGDLRLEVHERTESHALQRLDGVTDIDYLRQVRLEEQKNNTITQTQLSFFLSHPASSVDTIVMTGSSVKSVYNTPSASNSDDRDELFLVGGARWIHRFSPMFTASIAADINLRHTVYIFSERSANNTWNRVLSLSPTTDFRLGSRFRSRNGAQIIANYTVYDFENAAQSQRSFSLRQILFSDSTSFRIGGETTVDITLQIRMYEQGEIRWSAFTIRPLTFHNEEGITASVSQHLGIATVMVGLRYLTLSRYAFRELEKVRESETSSYGPICRANIHLPGGTGLLVDGWYQVTGVRGGERRTTPNLSIHMVWNL